MAGTVPWRSSGLDEARRLSRRGRIGGALAILVEIRHDSELSAPTDQELVPVLALTLDCHLALGDLASARELGDRLATEDGGPHAARALDARGELAAALGEHETAAELFLAAGAADGDACRPLLAWRSGAAMSLARTGRRRDALRLAHAQHARAVADGTGHDVASALRTLATLESDGSRVARLREARELLAFGESDRLRAQIDADLAGLLVLEARVDEAVALLRSVEDFASQQRLWPLQSRARRLLQRLGHTPRRMQDEALAILTVGERRVALLAAEGLANRAIAERLGVSVKAVEGHLSKIYRKLSLTSRTELAATVGPHD